MQWYKNIKAGYKKGLFFESADGNFKMKMRLRSQLQLSVDDTDNEDTKTNFEIRRLRIKWEGNAFRPWFLYEFQLDASDDVDLRTAYFEVVRNKMLVPRFGQFKVPFNREELTSSSSLQLVERSILNDEFEFGRDRGIALYGIFRDYITYGAGIFNGDGRNGKSEDSNLLYAGRIMFSPCCGKLKYDKLASFPAGGDYEIKSNFGDPKKLTIALGGGITVIPGLNIDRKTPDGDIDNRFEEIFGEEDSRTGDVISLTADASLKYSIFNFEGEYNARWIDPESIDFISGNVFDQGFRVQGGVFLVPELLEFAGRYASVYFDGGIEGRDKIWEITSGLNYYISGSHKWKLQFSYTFLKNEFNDSDDTGSSIFRTQLQAYF